MNYLTNTLTRATLAVRHFFAALHVVALSLLPAPALARVRASRGLSFLEYAILAAAIVGVGVLLAVFFRDSITNLTNTTRTGLGGL
jgi:hypothetical protein